MYLFIMPGFCYFLLFEYLPLVGNVIAFKDYSPFLGIRESPWVGLENFQALLTDPDVGLALRNTLVISFLSAAVLLPSADRAGSAAQQHL